MSRIARTGCGRSRIGHNTFARAGADGHGGEVLLELAIVAARFTAAGGKECIRAAEFQGSRRPARACAGIVELETLAPGEPCAKAQFAVSLNRTMRDFGSFSPLF